jgi:hypothetical protein
MRKAILAGTIALIGVAAAGCGQPGGYGYGPGYGGYGPSYGYPQQGFYSQPAANPLAQVLGAMMTPSGGFGQGYYQPAPAYGPRYF